MHDIGCSAPLRRWPGFPEGILQLRLQASQGDFVDSVISLGLEFMRHPLELVLVDGRTDAVDRHCLEP